MTIGRENVINSNSDLKFILSWPVIKDRLYFFTNFRTQDVSGHLNGVRRFEVWNLSNFYDQDSSKWFSENTGDSSYVPMNKGQYSSFMGKLSYNLGSVKLGLMLNVNNSVSRGYSHIYKYNPDGRGFGDARTTLTMLQLNHFINNKMFYDLKYSRWLFETLLIIIKSGFAIKDSFFNSFFLLIPNSKIQ